MTISPLGELELLLVVAPQHPLARHRAPLSWRTLRRYRAVATGEGGALLSDQETLTVCDAAGQLALLRTGAGLGVPAALSGAGSAGQRRAGLHDRARAISSSTRMDCLGMTPPAVWLANGGGKRY